MKPILKISLKDKKMLKSIYSFAKTRRVRLYLVGGFLRDLLLGREKENPDFDFCLKKEAISFGKKLAKKMKAGFVILDKEHGACRLVKRMNPVRDLRAKYKRHDVSNGVKDKICTLDFTDFRGKTIEEDLRHRDFTMNALAIDLENIFRQDNPFNLLIDPYQGSRDLEGKVIKVTNKNAFDEDPLRILRAFSLSCIFGFKISQETLRLIKFKKNKLREVSFERIRDELFKILSQPDAFNYIVKMDKIGILSIIIPEIKVMLNVKQGPYHHLDVWQHSLETLREAEGLSSEFKNNQELSNYLNQVISSERKRYALIKLGAFLHDIGKPKAKRKKDGKTTFYGHERIGFEFIENIAKRLKLSNDEENALRKIVLCHLRPGYLADIKVLTQRAKFRFFRDANTEAISILLLSIADQRATKGRLTTRESRIRHERLVFGLIKEYFERLKEKKPARLINGDELLKRFKLEPSPLIGKILSEIEELTAMSKIKTKREAFSVAKKFIEKSKV